MYFSVQNLTGDPKDTVIRTMHHMGDIIGLNQLRADGLSEIGGIVTFRRYGSHIIPIDLVIGLYNQRGKKVHDKAVIYSELQHQDGSKTTGKDILSPDTQNGFLARFIKIAGNDPVEFDETQYRFEIDMSCNIYEFRVSDNVLAQLAL